jgi:ABC-type phosphate transport system substrate-binding protein
MRSRIAKGAAIVATAAAATAIFAGSALADPPASHTVALTDVVGVGSDTTEIVMNDATTGPSGFDATTSPANYVDSWNATGTTPIVTKPGCSIPRPDGSSAGITALINTPLASDGTTPCIDFARSSRGPKTGDTDLNGNPLQFLPYASDGLRYATSAPTPAFPSVPVTNAPQNLTAAQLAAIFTCTDTTWTQVGGTSTDTIQPVIPQAGSGTRTFFEQSIGITDSQLGACVITGQEHDPTPVRANADRIAPFSVARFNSVDSNAGIQLNTSGFTATREVYNVAKLDPATLAVVANVQPIFGDGSGTVSSTTNWICSAAGQAVVKADGFTPLPVGTAAGDCGVAESA